MKAKQPSSRDQAIGALQADEQLAGRTARAVLDRAALHPETRRLPGWALSAAAILVVSAIGFYISSVALGPGIESAWTEAEIAAHEAALIEARSGAGTAEYWDETDDLIESSLATR